MFTMQIDRKKLCTFLRVVLILFNAATSYIVENTFFAGL